MHDGLPTPTPAAGLAGRQAAAARRGRRAAGAPPPPPPLPTVVLLILLLEASAAPPAHAALADNGTLLYILHHDDASAALAARIFGGAPYARLFRLGRSPYFESAFFLSAATMEADGDWRGKGFVGLLTYKWALRENPLKAKLLQRLAPSWLRPDLGELTRGVPSELDVVAFGKVEPDMVAQTRCFHPTLLAPWAALLAALGVNASVALAPGIPFWANSQWAARPRLFSAYAAFARRAMSAIEADARLKAMFDADSRYRGGLSPDALMAISGKPFYTQHAFALERLPALFFHMRGVRVASVKGEPQGPTFLQEECVAPPPPEPPQPPVPPSPPSRPRPPPPAAVKAKVDKGGKKGKGGKKPPPPRAKVKGTGVGPVARVVA